jgi:hypothetical protein
MTRRSTWTERRVHLSNESAGSTEPAPPYGEVGRVSFACKLASPTAC